MIAREDLDDVAPGVAEDDVVFQEVEEPAGLEHALEHGFQFRRALRREIVAGDRAPGHEPLAVGGQRADPRREAVGDHQRGVGAKQRRDLRLVGLELMERPVDGRVLVAGVLQLDHGERQAVDEDHDVGPPVGVVLDHRELVDREPVVGVRVVEVDQPRLLAADGSVGAPHLDRHALDEVAMQPPVLGDQRWRLRVAQLGEDLGAGLGGQGRIEPGDGGAQAVEKQHLAVVLALGRAAVGADVEAVRRGVAKLGEPRERGFLDVALGDGAYGVPPDRPKTNRARSRRSIS